MIVQPDFLLAPWRADDAPALSFEDCSEERDVTYATLARQVRELSEQLLAAGVEPGQVVACDLARHPDAICTQHALARIGAILLPLPPAVSDNHDALIAGVAAEWRCRPSVEAGVALPPTGYRADADRNSADPLAVIIATSGSSGGSRTVMLSRRNVLASCALVNMRLGLGPGDEWLCCLPLHHVGGLAIGYRCALAGAALRLHPAFDADAVAKDLLSRAVTHLSLVPPMLARLLDIGARPPPSLRVVLIGGQALGPALAERAFAAGWPIYVTYGMTETFSQVATKRYAGPADSPSNIGSPLPGVEIDCGACGEPPRALRIRGPMVMAGYGNPRRAAGQGLDGGWLVTSDLGCRDGDGGLCILGRADDVLVIGGVNVLPLRVEQRLGAAPDIGEVAVFGVPHPVWGQTLAVCYTGPIPRPALEAWCRSQLAGSERPRIFIRRAQLPLLSSGKVDRGALRALAEQVRGGGV